jgi:hypothetical protein
MKIKLQEIVDGYQAIRRLGAEKMPVQLAYTIQRNMRLMLQEYTEWDKKRVDLIKLQYGVMDEKKNWSVPPEKQEAFNADLAELGNVELELDIHPIPIEQFATTIAPNDLMVLAWMFEGFDPKKSNPKKH